MKIKNYLWAAPFISFFAGYLLLERISHVEQLEAPSIVGTQLQKAVAELSAKNLNLRLIAQKQDQDLPQGTILSQTPSAGQKIKPHQALYVVISKKPQKIAAPLLLNKTSTVIERELEAVGIRTKSYALPSPRPVHTCIAQLPGPGMQLDEGNIITYRSSGNHKPVLMPDLKGKTVSEVTEFLQRYNVTIDVIQTSNTENQNDIITDQRPLAGSIENIHHQKPLLIQLQVQ